LCCLRLLVNCGIFSTKNSRLFICFQVWFLTWDLFPVFRHLLFGPEFCLHFRCGWFSIRCQLHAVPHPHLHLLLFFSFCSFFPLTVCLRSPLFLSFLAGFGSEFESLITHVKSLANSCPFSLCFKLIFYRINLVRSLFGLGHGLRNPPLPFPLLRLRSILLSSLPLAAPRELFVITDRLKFFFPNGHDRLSFFPWLGSRPQRYPFFASFFLQ